MTVWDRLCELLRARNVSVEDVSNKVSRNGTDTILHVQMFLHQGFTKVSSYCQLRRLLLHLVVGIDCSVLTLVLLKH